MNSMKYHFWEYITVDYSAVGGLAFSAFFITRARKYIQSETNHQSPKTSTDTTTERRED